MGGFHPSTTLMGADLPALLSTAAQDLHLYGLVFLLEELLFSFVRYRRLSRLGVFCIPSHVYSSFYLVFCIYFSVAVCSRIIRSSFVLLEFLILGYDDGAKGCQPS